MWLTGPAHYDRVYDLGLGFRLQDFGFRGFGICRNGVIVVNAEGSGIHDLGLWV